jgi:hypothetical protein
VALALVRELPRVLVREPERDRVVVVAMGKPPVDGVERSVARRGSQRRGSRVGGDCRPVTIAGRLLRSGA